MLEVGIKGCKEIIVSEADTALLFKSGELEVLATPKVVMLVEETAYKSISDNLETNESTVGTKVDLKHIAATPIGMKVMCETELIEIDRRRLVFSFTVKDEKEVIAEGIHERFIIDKEKFLNKVNSK